MSLKNIWTVLCKDIITDQETNSVSYIRCLEEASATELPVQVGPFFVATLWEKDKEDLDEISFRIVLSCPNKEKQVLISTKAVKLERPKHRLHFRINNLELKQFGRYTIFLEWKKDKYWTKVVQIPLTLSKNSS